MSSGSSGEEATARDRSCVRMAGTAWDVVREHAERLAPQECCGLLIGAGRHVAMAWPARNVSGTPATRYEVDPRDHFAALRHARAGHLAVVGAYHSHPRSAPLPSATDRAEAHSDFVYLIVGRAAGGSWLPRAFSLAEGNFDEQTFVIEA